MKTKEIANAIREKNKDFKSLDDFVKSYSMAEPLRGQAKKISKKEKVEIKQEPVSYINDREAKKKGLCYKCNEKWDHKENCKARNRKCKKCGREGHLEIACWKGKKAKQEKVDKKAKRVGQVKEKVEEEASTEDDSEDTSSSFSSDTSIFHIIEKTDEEPNSVKAIFELKDEGEHYILNIRANGKTFECLLDTGSPISIMPQSYRDLLKPKRLVSEQTKRNFVDVNNNPVNFSARYHLKTSLLDKTEKLMWWEVKEINFPILGMDNYQKLGLKIIQDAEDNIEDRLKPTKTEENESEKEMVACIENKVDQLKRETLRKLQALFVENRTLKEFKFKVEFKSDFKVEQQKGRRIPIHVQEAAEKELQRLMK